jgi:hypothetical protein
MHEISFFKPNMPYFLAKFWIVQWLQTKQLVPTKIWACPWIGHAIFWWGKFGLKPNIRFVLGSSLMRMAFKNNLCIPNLLFL